MVAHGDTLLRDGGFSDADDASRVLRELGRLPATAPVVLVACESGAQRRDQSGLVRPAEAQAVADASGRVVYAPTVRVGVERMRDGSTLLYLRSLGPDGDTGRFRLFRPGEGTTPDQTPGEDVERDDTGAVLDESARKSVESAEFPRPLPLVLMNGQPVPVVPAPVVQLPVQPVIIPVSPCLCCRRTDT